MTGEPLLKKWWGIALFSLCWVVFCLLIEGDAKDRYDPYWRAAMGLSVPTLLVLSHKGVRDWLWLKSKPLRWVWQGWTDVLIAPEMEEMDDPFPPAVDAGSDSMMSWLRRNTEAMRWGLHDRLRVVTTKEMEEQALGLSDSGEEGVKDESVMWGMGRAQRRAVVVTLVVLAGLFGWYNLGYRHREYLSPSRFFYGVAVPVALLGAARVFSVSGPKRSKNDMTSPENR